MNTTPYKKITLLSIGRFAYQKNFDNVPYICRKLLNILSAEHFTKAKNYDTVPDITQNIVEQGIPDIKWFLIGFGGDEDLIHQKIIETKMENHVFILGKKENPYPYIKACNIYIQPSRYEGKSITVREAQILCKPVIITNYPTAQSQVEDRVNGIIVPMDNEGCARGIADLIMNPDLQQTLIKNCKKRDFSSISEVNKIYSLLP